jgi:hypothetical protein
MLFALELLADGGEFNRELFLLPTQAEDLRDPIPPAADGSMKATTAAAFIEELETRARRSSLPPGLVTAFRINPATRRFALSQAQMTWLGCRGRTLILHGALTDARICTPTFWAQWMRDT